MTGPGSSPSGFSYAQAAKMGRGAAAAAAAAAAATATATATVAPTSVAPSQQAASKVASSGTATPATSVLSDLTPSSGNWADDVEESVGEKIREPVKEEREQGNPVPAKAGPVDRAKSEEKARRGGSGTSSPEPVVTPSTNSTNDETSSAPNGSASETTWETTSSTSVPEWIAHRSERQTSESTAKAENRADDAKLAKEPKEAKESKEPKEMPLPSPPKPDRPLQEALPPPVNPWVKRAEEMKVKLAAQQQAAKAIATPPAADTSAMKENQRPRADSRKKAASIAGLSAGEEARLRFAHNVRKTGAFENKHLDDTRADASNVSSKPRSDDAVGSNTTKLRSPGRSSLPNLLAAPPSVADEVLWPTPDTVQEKERKDSAEKDPQDKRSDDSTPVQKPRKKEWKSMAVTPNIIFETPMKESRPRALGERGGRGGGRGRGGRGPAGAGNGNERNSARTGASHGDVDDSRQSDGRQRSNTIDRQAMPPPPKPQRASSDPSIQKPREEAYADHNANDESVAEGEGTCKAPPKSSNVRDTAKADQRFAKSYEEMTRAESRRSEARITEAKDEDAIPPPVPRRASIGTQTDETGEPLEKAPRNAAPIRMVPSDNRKEQRGIDNFKDAQYAGPLRGAKRGGRGRGGVSRDLANIHTPNHAFGGGFAPEYTVASPYGINPASPPFQAPRGNPQSGYSQQARGGMPRGNPRSQSIPIDTYYGRLPPQYGGPQAQLPPVQTYAPGIYEYVYPMSAMPFQPYMDQDVLLSMVTMQLEHYFSLNNLHGDEFLRKNMDTQGFVLLDLLATFKRLKTLTEDRELLKTACINSKHLEIVIGEDGKERIRKREGWRDWTMPMDMRHPGAQNDGPRRLKALERPQPQTYGQFPLRGPASAPMPDYLLKPDRRSYDAYGITNGAPEPILGFAPMPEAEYRDIVSEEDARGRAAKSPLREATIPPNTAFSGAAGNRQADSDTFPDHGVDDLTVIIKLLQPHVSRYSAASRTFSNGSIDIRSIASEMERHDETQSTPTANGEATTNGSANSPNLSRHVSPHAGRLTEPASNDGKPIIYWIKNNEDAENAESIPEGLHHQPYRHLHDRALEQRSQAATGTCPYDMEVLYAFWSHFLVRNFNASMYGEFKYYAHEDATSRHNTVGLKSLIRYYNGALLSQSQNQGHNPPIRDCVVADYVDLVRHEPVLLEGLAFKSLRNAWRNGAMNMRNRKKLSDTVDDELLQRLES